MVRSQELEVASFGGMPKFEVVSSEIIASFLVQHLCDALCRNWESSNNSLNILSDANLRAHETKIKIKSRNLSNVLIFKRQLV